MPGRQIAGPTTCMITEVGSLPRTKRICNDSRPTAISFRIPRSLFQQWFSGTARSQSGLGTAAWRLVCALARSSLRRSRRAFNLPRVTVYADALDESDLLNAVNLGVGRVVVGSVEHIQLLRSVAVQRAQDVIIRMTDVNTPFAATADFGDLVRCGFRFDSNQADAAIAALLDHEWLNLVGLHCEVGSRDHDFVSFPAAIGHMIAEMAQVRRNHGKVLTRLGLGGGRAVPSGRWAVELPKPSTQIDESLNDACATLRFPRPFVILSTGLGIIGQTAA